MAAKRVLTMKKFIALLLALTLVLTITACTKKEELEEDETDNPSDVIDTSEVPSSPSPSPEVSEVLYRNQFNGEPLDEPSNIRPFAVMINNHLNAQPQCGTSDADIIFEILAEGGITRMMAIFSDISSADIIGPIRSIRPYYISIGISYDAVVVHAGGSVPDAYDMLRLKGVNNLDGVNGYYTVSIFYRDQSRMYLGTEHTLFSTGEKLIAGAESKEYELEVGDDYSSGLVFSDDVELDGDDAAKMKFVFNSGKSTSFTYHEDEGYYTAFQHGSDYYDGNTGENVEFSNVIAITAVTRVIDNYARLEVELIGEGEGYFFNGGKVCEIIWSRESDEDPIVYTYTDGTPVELSPGKTYVAILPTDTGDITFE